MLDAVRPCARDELVTALNEAGLGAREFAGQSGRSRVVVPILDMTAETPVTDAENPEIRAYLSNTAESWGNNGYLYIAAEESGNTCQIGVIGVNGETGEEYRSEEWERVDSFEEAIRAFNNLYEQRDTFISIFTGRSQG